MNGLFQDESTEGSSLCRRSCDASCDAAPCSIGGFDRGPDWWKAAVLGLTFLGVFLRFFVIDHNSLWLDEAVTCGAIKVPIFDLVAARAIPDQGNPPLYFILGGAWNSLFGDSEVGLRSFPAMCGSLTIPLLALVGRRLAGWRVGLWGAFLMAVSPTAVELSNEARPYALVGLLAVAATLFFVRWVEMNRRLDLASYSVSVLLIVSTHYYGAAVPLAHAAGLAALPRERRRIESWICAVASAYFLGLPVLNILLLQVEMEGNLSRMGDRWATQFLATPMVFGLGRNLGWRDASVWRLGALTASALVGFWIPAGLALARRGCNRFGRTLLGSWFLIPIVVPLIVALTLSPVYATRYAFVGLPPFLLLTGWGLQLCRPAARWMLVGLVLILTSSSLYLYATRAIKDDWRVETRFIMDRLKPGEFVAFEPAHEFITFEYYVNKYGLSCPPMLSTSSGLGDGGRPRESMPGVWLVCCAVGEVGRASGYLDRAGLRLVERRRSGRIEIYHYIREAEPGPRSE